jgi:hypothetical protein
VLPLIVIGGVIGAVASAAKGVSWLSDQIESAQGSGSAGGKPGPTPLSKEQASAFAATLAAQTAGQGLPPSLPVSTAPNAVPQLNGTDYAMLDRMKAGLAAYDRVGQRHGNHAGAVAEAPGDNSSR